MERGLILTNFKVRSGDKIIVRGKLASDAKRFAVNLGQNDENVLIHFNPRFDEDCGVIVCNSKRDGKLGGEKRYCKLSFQKGEKVEFNFSFEGKDVKVRFSDEITFKSELKLDYIEHLAVFGDFKVESIHLE